VLRVEISEVGQEPLPALDIGDRAFVIGSSPTARVRLPDQAAKAEHVRIDGTTWRTDDESGDIGEGITIEIGTYRVRIVPAPSGVAPSPPQRTESLARELMRGLLGDGAAPVFEVERGPLVGATKRLAPPESTLVIGRGDEASWIIMDEDLSRTHAEVKRGWDGTRIIDLGSKNGTRVDGVVVTAAGTPLRDGVLVELGKVAIRFRDAADRKLAPQPTVAMRKPTPAPTAETKPRAPESVPPTAKASAVPFYVALAIMFAALGGLVWVLSL
jgi:hypothetical protein